MQADVYLVFNRYGVLLKTRLLTQHSCFGRSVFRATEFAQMSKELIDLGSQESFSVFTQRTMLEAMQRYDAYVELTSIKVATIDI